MKRKKVFVSGCFDMLHSGHVRFLEEAAGYGDVHVAIGSDQTVRELKGRAPVNTQAERQYMLEALRHVKTCRISRGSGLMDFLAELERVAPDIFVVNEDGNTPAKAELCRQRGIQYVVLQAAPAGQSAGAFHHQPAPGMPDSLPARSGGRLAGPAVRFQIRRRAGADHFRGAGHRVQRTQRHGLQFAPARH